MGRSLDSVLPKDVSQSTPWLACIGKKCKKCVCTRTCGTHALAACCLKGAASCQPCFPCFPTALSCVRVKKRRGKEPKRVFINGSGFAAGVQAVLLGLHKHDGMLNALVSARVPLMVGLQALIILTRINPGVPRSFGLESSQAIGPT